jgi:outer membrane immunogenic protein
MKKLLLGAAALVVLGMAAPASAADLTARPYTRAPVPMIAAVYDWSGFYSGVNGGYGSSRKCWDLVNNNGTLFNPAVAEGCHDASGATAGGQIGYRWQASSWVFGLEAQGNWADFKGSNTNLFVPASGPITDRSRVGAFGLFTGQIGYAWDNTLLYLKGGAAVTGDKYTTINVANGLTVDRADETRWGSAIGGGIEFGFAPNWSVGVEYDHLFMGTRNVNATAVSTNFGSTAGAFSATDRIRQDVDLATVRVNYRWGGPLVAKY